MLAGSEAFVERARRTRKLMGGGMRQAGVIAAPGLLALENRERLDVDHENARRLAAELDDLEGLSVPVPETNIVLVDTTETGLSAAEFLENCEAEGCSVRSSGSTRCGSARTSTWTPLTWTSASPPSSAPAKRFPRSMPSLNPVNVRRMNMNMKNTNSSTAAARA